MNGEEVTVRPPEAARGRRARTVAGVYAVLLNLFMGFTVYRIVDASWPELEIWKPTEVIVLTLAILCAAVSAVIGGGIAWMVLSRKSVVANLVETDNEMNKVTWATWDEVKNSTAVVIALSLILSLLMAFLDMVYSRALAQLIRWL